MAFAIGFIFGTAATFMVMCIIASKKINEDTRKDTMIERKQVGKMNENEENKQDLDTVISHMQVLKYWLGDSLTQKSFKESVDVAIKCVKKQIPKKMKNLIKRSHGFHSLGKCPVCDINIVEAYSYCPMCGQRLDWEGGE